MTEDQRIEHCNDALKTAHRHFEKASDKHVPNIGPHSAEVDILIRLQHLAEGLSTLTGLGIFMIKEAEKDNEL